MKEWLVPINVKGLRGFLGLTGYYRKFIKNYGMISKPLTDQLKKDAFKWDSEAQNAFEQLKDAMTQAPVLALPDFAKQFIVETDASNGGIGAVLIQEKKLIAFMSQKLGVRNIALSTYDKELLALISAVVKWRHYLLGSQFVIRTDHISLKFFLEQKINTTLQHKGLSKLIGLDFVIEYKKGKDNVVADALSRKEENEKESSEMEEGLWTISEIRPQWIDEVQDSYIGDEWIENLKEKLSGTNLLSQEEQHLTQHQGIIRKKWRVCIDSNGQLRRQILEALHSSTIGGHSGITVTYQRVKKSFYWPKLKEVVHQFVRECENYQFNKPKHLPTPGLLQPLAIPDEAWSSIGMDFIT